MQYVECPECGKEIEITEGVKCEYCEKVFCKECIPLPWVLCPKCDEAFNI